MTPEELEEKTLEYWQEEVVEKKIPLSLKNIELAIKDAFKAGYRKAEENLKCCGNCKHHEYWGIELHCTHPGFCIRYESYAECREDKWEQVNE